MEKSTSIQWVNSVDSLLETLGLLLIFMLMVSCCQDQETVSYKVIHRFLTFDVCRYMKQPYAAQNMILLQKLLSNGKQLDPD